jgi:hypothetical protein
VLERKDALDPPQEQLEHNTSKPQEGGGRGTVGDLKGDPHIRGKARKEGETDAMPSAAAEDLAGVLGRGVRFLVLVAAGYCLPLQPTTPSTPIW